MIKVATLSPMYVLEGGFEIYKELAQGPFSYRIGDLITDEKRKLIVNTSPKTIDELLDKDPPMAIFAGYEGDLDLPLIRYAERNEYHRVDDQFDKGVLYIRGP